MQIALPVAAYIHIPFCRRRCYYCDFPITVLGNHATQGTTMLIAEYVTMLCREISQTLNKGKRLETVFFGGGTPSLLPVIQLDRILATLDQYLGIATNAEISMEIDPGTFSLEQLQGYVDLGVNRVSLGIQAFQDSLLSLCGRSHNTRDIFTAVDTIRQVGITNLSFDLISGLPQQTLNQWQESLVQAINLQPQHISCYDLVLEPVTAFGKQYQPGIKPLPDDHTTATMYQLAATTLKNSGYEHYEISNYAKPGFPCRHNRVYWENQSYYGFGMGAASYTNCQRFTRPRTRREYYAWLETGARIDTPETDNINYLLETLMLGLRLAEGVNLTKIKQQFGDKIINQIYHCLEPYLAQGWVEVIDCSEKEMTLSQHCDLSQSTRLRLHDPDGFLFSNTILASLFKDLDK